MKKLTQSDIYWSIRPRRKLREEQRSMTKEERAAYRASILKLEKHRMCKYRFKTEKEAKRHRTSEGFSGRLYEVIEGFDIFF